jgi:signal transduction histidine kinase
MTTRCSALQREAAWVARARAVVGSLAAMGGAAWMSIEPGPRGAGVLAGGLMLVLAGTLVDRVVELGRGAGWRISTDDHLTALMSVDVLALAVIALCTGLAGAAGGGARAAGVGVGVGGPVLMVMALHAVVAGVLLPRSRAVALSFGGVVLVGAGVAWAQRAGLGQSAGAGAGASGSVWSVAVLAGWGGCVLAGTLVGGLARAGLAARDSALARESARNEELWSRLVAQQNTLVQAEKMASMGQMVAGLAHEITNPLASMDSVLQLMQRHPGSPRPEAVATLRQQIQRILGIMRQFTTYAHPGRGVVQPVLLSSLVQSSLDMLAFNRELKRVEVVRELDDGVGAVMLNPRAMEQVITNLVTNALDAVAQTPSPRLTIRAVRGAETCAIEVGDNGCGIAPEDLRRIFEQFFTTKPAGKGTGLGLAICARLVKEAGGSISVRSTLGAGSVFTITLPTVEPAEAARSTGEANDTGAAAEAVLSVETPGAGRGAGRQRI